MTAVTNGCPGMVGWAEPLHNGLLHTQFADWLLSSVPGVPMEPD